MHYIGVGLGGTLHVQQTEVADPKMGTYPRAQKL
jgi:hypothetical protein